MLSKSGVIYFYQNTPNQPQKTGELRDESGFKASEASKEAKASELQMKSEKNLQGQALQDQNKASSVKVSNVSKVSTFDTQDTSHSFDTSEAFATFDTPNTLDTLDTLDAFDTFDTSAAFDTPDTLRPLASKKPVVSAPVPALLPTRPPARTVPQLLRPTPSARPLVARKPVFSVARPVVKTPERPANPFPGNVVPAIEELKSQEPGVKEAIQPSSHSAITPASIPSAVTVAKPVVQPNLTTNLPVVSDTTTPKLQTLNPKPSFPIRRLIGAALVLTAIAGITFPILPQARLETSYATQQLERRYDMMVQPTIAMPPSVPISFSPLIGPDGKEIEPINKDYSIVVPKLGINAAIIASVDPLNPKDYTEALKKGVAHAKTSYFPDQDGAVYLFSHSTNYEWFVKDLNAIFYNLKNLEDGDLIVIFYKGKRYTYKYVSREIVAPRDTTYLLPVTGKRQLILQTCWPPGTLAQRMLIFADFVEEHGTEI